MKKSKIFSALAVVTLLLPLIGSFVYVPPVSAAALQGKVMRSYQTQSNNLYTGTVTEYTFSLNGVVQQSSLPPTEADWITPSNFYDNGWTNNSSNEVFTYSNFGEINQTNDPMSIPSTATWATISAFYVASSGSPSIPAPPIRDTKFHYSVNGVDVLEETNALTIPTNALWVALVNFQDGWTQSINHAFTNYTINRTAPAVQSFTISSNSGNPAYAKKGNTVTVALQTDIPIAPPVIKIADIELTATGAGTAWSASLELTDAINEGALSVSASVFTTNGAPGPVLDSTTNGSLVTYDNTGPSLSYTLTPSDATNQNVGVQVQASDAISGLRLLKFAAGTYTESYFATNGISFISNFTVITNGNYTVYAEDHIGNVTLLPITVSNIDRVAPNVSLTPSTIALSHTNVVVQVTATDNVAIGNQLWAEGLQDKAYFQGGGGISFTNQFDAVKNGVYTVYVEDTAGNYVLDSITVTNILKQAPVLTLTPTPVTPTKETVFVDVVAQTEREAEGNILVALRWAEGEQNTGFFTSGGGEDILDELEFEGVNNGKYSVYGRDKAGNETVATIDISNIDRTAPRLTLTPNTTAQTNGHVIITVTVEDDESGISKVRWSSVAPAPDLPWSSSEVVNGAIQATANGMYTVMAVDKAGNETLQQITVTNIRTEKPTVALTPSTTQPTSDKVSVTVEATASGNGNAIDKVLWAEGVQPVSYFPGGQSEDITGALSFEVTTNGSYTVYARDLAGNETIETIDITNIDRVAPSVSLTASTTELTNANVVVQVAAADNVAIGKKLWAEGLQDAAYFQAGSGTALTNQFAVAQNGVYTVYVEDTAGNHAIAAITVSNLFKQAPELTLTPSPVTPTTDTVFVGVDVKTEGKAQGNTLVALRWAEGERTKTFFTSGGGEDILDELEFEGAENGKYSAYARDKAGNETVATIDISNIDRVAPRLTLTSNPTTLTNGHVVITVTAEDDESGISEVRWSATAPVPDLPWSSSEVMNGSFQVASNGMYTVKAVDKAGNETIKQINVTNIQTDKPTLLLSPSTNQPTGDRVSVTVKATAAGNGNGIEEVLWAEGEQAISYFHGGQSDDITDALGFDTSTNGAYTVYARDRAGNEAVETIEIANLDHAAPTVSLTASTTTLTNSNVVVQVAAADNVAIGKQLWAEGLQDKAYFQGGGGTPLTNQFIAAKNGVYTVYVEDTAGNHAIATIMVSNVFKQAPKLTLTPSPVTPTNGTVTVGVDAKTAGEADGNILSALRWAEDEQDPAYFASGGGSDILDPLEFEGIENGKYSVYARDKAGNETVAAIQISNIDRTAPRLTLTPNTTNLTNKHVVITVSAEDAESGLSEVRWSATAPVPDLPWPSSEVANGSFQVTLNGTYTVIAVDKAGNETLQQITVGNIHTAIPMLVLSPDTTQPTGDKVSVRVKATALGDGNAIEEILWTEGEQAISYFREGQSKDITDTLEFDAATNGTYTVYARDLAGNEAVATVKINNIRSTDASLAALVVQNANQVLSLSPSFSPEQLHYTLQVRSNVSAIQLKAGAEVASASVSVNGNPLATGDSISVSLSPGVNTIRIVVTAPLASVQQIYTIEATRERPASSGNESSTAFSAKLNGQEWTGLDETIRSSQNGQLVYDLMLDDAASMVDFVASDGENELRIELNGQAAQQVDAVTFKMSAKALSQLKGHSIRIILGIGEAVYEIPSGVQVIGDGELVVNVQALRQSSETEQLLRKVADLPEVKKWQPKPVGVPIAFSSNATDNMGSIVLPLPVGLDENELRKLAVYFEGNQNSIMPATIRYNSKGQAIGIALEATASGRAIVLQAEPVRVAYESYINGYSDGSFAPDRAVTRAELATLLMKLSSQAGNASTASNTNTKFADVSPSHWAAEAIALAANGWMSGYPDGSFDPNKPLTRAELASILARWRELQGSGSSSFADANSHWAALDIASAEREGWITGYADGSFRPGRSVTRAEAVTILNRVLHRPLHIGSHVWSDVPASHWAAGAIGSASQSLEAHYYLSGEVEVTTE